MSYNITCISIYINGYSTEDAGACALFLFFPGGIKFKLLIQLGDFGSHVATLHIRRTAVRQGEIHLDLLRVEPVTHRVLAYSDILWFTLYSNI